jgi:uncharacterized RDD family membrane protein YckC
MIATDTHTPALPGSSGSDLAPQPVPIREAGFVSRLAAFVLDVVIVSLTSIAFAALNSLILNFFGFSARDFSLEAPASTVIAVLQLIIIAVTGLAVLLFIPAYFILCWVLVGATPGKYILGLKVIRTGGQRISVARGIIRLVGYWISALPLFLGYLWILLGARRQGWHDKLADTIVVYTWHVPD